MDMDMLNMMFGGGGMGGAKQQRRRKGKDVGLALPVGLADLFNGKVQSIPRQKTIICPGCKGSGANKPGISAVCQACAGRGARMEVRQMGPGMITQTQVPCEKCRGTGGDIAPQDRCSKCNGKRTEVVEAPLKVAIKPGMTHNTQIPFRMEGDQDPDIEVPGDIVIVLQQKEKEEEKFTRDGDDLHVKHHISIEQALCGGETYITQLDGRKLVMRWPKGQLIKPGDKRQINGEGMPIEDGGKGQAGNMIVEFIVDFPERLQESQIEMLQQVLPMGAPPVSYDPDNCEENFLTRQPIDDIKKAAEEEDEDDEQGGGVRCAQQ